MTPRRGTRTGRVLRGLRALPLVAPLAQGPLLLLDLPPDLTAPRLSGRPVAEPNPAGWYRQPVEVRWSVADGGSGVAAPVPAGRVEGEGAALRAAATVFDRAGNHRTAVVEPALQIDLTPPVTTLEVPPGWASTDRTVGLAATDNLSGVAATSFRVDGGQPQVGDMVTVQGAGRHTVEYWSQDVAGNAERHRTAVLHLDGRAPAVSHRLHPAANPAGWYRGPVTVSFRCEPGAAPVSRCPSSRRVGTDGAGIQVSGQAVDLAGRESDGLAAVSIDRTAPVVAARADHVPASGGWYGEPVTLTFSCWDALSGIRPGGCPVPVTLAEGAGQRVDVRAGDVAGNTAELGVEGIDVDTTAPSTRATTTIAPAVPGRPRAVRVTLRAADQLSGVARTLYRLDGGQPQPYLHPLQIDTAGEHTLSFWSVDRAGQVEQPPGQTLTILVESS